MSTFSRPRRPMGRPALLALALIAAVAALPAYAGDTCATFDGNPDTEGNAGSLAGGSNAIACGLGARATGNSSVAMGTFFDLNGNGIADLEVDTDGDGVADATELVVASGLGATAFGSASLAAGDFSTALGSGSSATSGRATAVGALNIASGNQSTALGNINLADAEDATAVGTANEATGQGSTALGTSNNTKATFATAVGAHNDATGHQSTAIGLGNDATGQFSTALGISNRASGGQSTAVGRLSTALGPNSIALGSWIDLDNSTDITPDIDIDNDGIFESTELTLASGAEAIAIGAATWATGARSSAFGAGAVASADNSVALGSFSVADQPNTVSVGAVGTERRIVNVAAGTQGTDAVNKNQLDGMLDTAKAYTDTTVATGGTKANAYTDDQVKHVRNDMEAGDKATLNAANAYTDQQLADFGGFNDRFDAIDRRFGQQDQRISRIGALSAAMSQSSAIAAMGGGPRGAYGIGAAVQGGTKALAVGWGKRFGSHTLTLGGAFSGSERSASIGFGGQL